MAVGSSGSAGEARSGGAAVPFFPVWLAQKLLARAFELLYDELAAFYDPISWLVSGGRWRSWQRAGLVDLPTGRVLEVGPGPGHLLLDLLDSGRDAIGLEQSAAMLCLARRRLADRGHASRLIAGDARRLPFLDRTFDGVYVAFPAPYVGSSFWLEAARVLRPGGRLVVILGAESGAWPWPGALEWALAMLTGRQGKNAIQELELAPGLRGRRVERQVGQVGVVSILLAERV